MRREAILDFKVGVGSNWNFRLAAQKVPSQKERTRCPPRQNQNNCIPTLDFHLFHNSKKVSAPHSGKISTPID